MPPSTQTFDRSALILAWLDSRKYSTAHEDLRNYHDKVHTAFTKAFGIDLDVPPSKGGIPDENGLHGLLHKVARVHEETRSPFSDYLCGTREISDIYRKYQEPLEKAATSLKNLHMMMLLELVELIWGGDSPHSVSQENLETCGHPEWNRPAPEDYW